MLRQPRKPRRTRRGATSSGTLLGKVLPEANNILVLVELILQLVPAAIFVLKMAGGVPLPPGKPPCTSGCTPAARTFCMCWLDWMEVLLP